MFAESEIIAILRSFATNSERGFLWYQTARIIWPPHEKSKHYRHSIENFFCEDFIN